jgi:hypothetical protein
VQELGAEQTFILYKLSNLWDSVIATENGVRQMPNEISLHLTKNKRKMTPFGWVP